MPSILFDKKGALRISRKVVLDHTSVTIDYCQRGFLEARVVKKFKESTDASVYFKKAVKAFRDVGLDEYENSCNGFIGTISYVENSLNTMSARIRVDSIGDVFFESKISPTTKLKEGQRVLVLDIAKLPKPKKSFMLGSPLRAAEVLPLPRRKVNPKKELPPAVVNKLHKEGMDFLKGCKISQKPKSPLQQGQLIYGFYSGIYRIIEINDDIVSVEEVYTAKLLRASGAMNRWAIGFCRPLTGAVKSALKGDLSLLEILC